MRDIVQTCFIGFSIQIEWAAVAEYLLNAEAFRFQNFVILVEECIKNCVFFGPNELKSLFYSAHLHVCMSTKLGRVLNNVACSSSILKGCCSLCEA